MKNSSSDLKIIILSRPSRHTPLTIARKVGFNRKVFVASAHESSGRKFGYFTTYNLYFNPSIFSLYPNWNEEKDPYRAAYTELGDSGSPVIIQSYNKEVYVSGIVSLSYIEMTESSPKSLRYRQPPVATRILNKSNSDFLKQMIKKFDVKICGINLRCQEVIFPL